MDLKCPEVSIQITIKRRSILLLTVKNLLCFISDFKITEQGEAYALQRCKICSKLTINTPERRQLTSLL